MSSTCPLLNLPLLLADEAIGGCPQLAPSTCPSERSTCPSEGGLENRVKSIAWVLPLIKRITTFPAAARGVDLGVG